MQQRRYRSPIPWPKSDGGLAEFRRSLRSVDPSAQTAQAACPQRTWAQVASALLSATMSPTRVSWHRPREVRDGASLDHLVGAREQRGWHGKAEHLRGRQINDK